jgi:NADH:ubiquinone oxidoreductase subunit H
MDWLLPLLIILAKSLALIAGLLIVVAYLLWADRNCVAARMLSGLGACCNLSPTF